MVHGDAAFAGQGITAETLNYAELDGYTVGGTIHVIVNNLIGFTTIAREAHSSRFAAQLARRQPVPIFHVNGEDIDAVVRVARMAAEYRYTFGTRRGGRFDRLPPAWAQRSGRSDDHAAAACTRRSRRIGRCVRSMPSRLAPKSHRARGGDQRRTRGRAESRARRLRRNRRCANCRRTGTTISAGAINAEYEVQTGIAREELAELTRAADDVSRGISHPSEGQEAAGTARGDGHGQKAARLRNGGSAGLWESAASREFRCA